MLLSMAVRGETQRDGLMGLMGLMGLVVLREHVDGARDLAWMRLLLKEFWLNKTLSIRPI